LNFRIVIFLALSSCRTSDAITSTAMESPLEQSRPATFEWERVVECREKVWPGVPFGDSPTAFVFSSGEEVRLWKKGWQDVTSNQRLHIQEYHEGLYSAVGSELTNGQPLLTIEASQRSIEAHMSNLKDFVTSQMARCFGANHRDDAWAAYVRHHTSAPGIVGLAFHEYLHAFSQPHWTYRQDHTAESNVSGEVDGLDIRKYTLAIEARLYDAVTDNDPTTSREKIAQALIFSDRFNAVSPDKFRDFGALTIQEGSAFYVELTASQIAAYGCSTPDENLDRSMIKELSELRPIIIALGLEGYLIGSYVSILLDRHGVVGWPSLVEKEPTSMLRILGLILGPSNSLEGSAEKVELFSDLASCLAEN